MPQLIIQPSGADSYIDSYVPNNNFGSNVDLYVGPTEVSGNPMIRRAVIKYDFSSLPNATVITAAQMLCYVRSGSAARTLWAYRLTRTNWTELGVTWNKYDGTNAWTAAGGDYTADDGASITSPGTGNWAEWNVLAQAQYALLNTSKILHCLLKDGTESGISTTYFHSKNYTTDTTLCPKLTLTYRYKNALWFGNG